MATQPQGQESADSSAIRKRNVRLREELWEGLDNVAAAQGVSTNVLLEAMASRVAGRAPAKGRVKRPVEAPDRLSIRFRGAEKQEVQRLAKGAGVSVTRWVMNLIRAQIKPESAEACDVAQPRDAASETLGGGWISIRMKEADRDELRQHAALMGNSVAGWIRAVIRARVRKAPLLSVAETEALAEANRQLAAVGRNLNTVVYKLHREGRWAGNLDLYADLLASVKTVRARVEAVIASGQARAEDE